MDSIWTNGSWQVLTTSNDFLFHYFILSISLSLVRSYSSNGTQFISVSSIIDKVQRKGGPLIKNRFQTTMQREKGKRASALRPWSWSLLYRYRTNPRAGKKARIRMTVPFFPSLWFLSVLDGSSEIFKLKKKRSSCGLSLQVSSALGI